MNTFELIKTRKSVRTFDGRPIDPKHREKLEAYIKNIPHPYGIPVEFVLLDTKEHEPSSPVIQGEELYIAATHSILCKLPAIKIIRTENGIYIRGVL